MYRIICLFVLCNPRASYRADFWCQKTPAVEPEENLRHVHIPVAEYEKLCVRGAWLVCDNHHPEMLIKVRPAAQRILASAYGKMASLACSMDIPAAVDGASNAADLQGLGMIQRSCITEILERVANDIVSWKNSQANTWSTRACAPSAPGGAVADGSSCAVGDMDLGRAGWVPLDFGSFLF